MFFNSRPLLGGGMMFFKKNLWVSQIIYPNQQIQIPKSTKKIYEFLKSYNQINKFKYSNQQEAPEFQIWVSQIKTLSMKLVMSLHSLPSFHCNNDTYPRDFVSYQVMGAQSQGPLIGGYIPWVPDHKVHSLVDTFLDLKSQSFNMTS